MIKLVCLLILSFCSAKPMGHVVRQGGRMVMDAGVAAAGIYTAYQAQDRRDSVASNPSGFNRNITWTTSKKPKISRSITKTGDLLVKRK